MTKFAPKRLDIKAFAEAGATLEGEQLLRNYPRLFAETGARGGDSPLEWSASGELRNPGHVQPEIWLHLRAGALLPLTCQRCLGPVEVEVEIDRSFRFVSDEDTAAAEDDESEEDVLALSREFDLVTLVEDEMLMGLPIAPRHETCPERLPTAVADEEFESQAAETQNPFAVLGRLKTRKS
ncbi:MAG TPA: DUF177 domain-containing protein [Ramlibacter sp.]|nr:DUF177 domain-containing protein [Ramlibacter sp.]